MADRTTQRRTLAGPNSKASSMADQTLKNPDPICPTKPSSMTKNHNNNINLSRSLDAAQTVRTSQKKPTSQNKLLLSLIDSAHFQAKSKAMSASAIVDSSKYSLSNANTGQPRRTVKDVDDTDNDKDSCKEKSKKSTKEVEKKQVCQVMIRREAHEEGQNKFSAQQRHSVSLPLAGTGAGAGTGRRRGSFCGSHIELVDVFASNGVKVVSVDMPPFMQIHAVEFARKAHDSLEKFTSKTLACALKKEFDGVYGPAWHCIVGTSFGSFVTHSVGGFLYFSMDQKLYILLFKTTVQRAD
ncbi:Dynein light chain [Trema orientale]|uniref:Dynein light chain n=1 Tax=Trema orientale TaxID=63057 RepID=A0A2P5F672_TREOI|nr:Dynein light chain [Trema orientale]